MANERLTIVRFWHFTCVECGMGDHELGRLAASHDVHCEVCTIELGQAVRLRRWPADEAAHAAAERMTQRAQAA